MNINSIAIEIKRPYGGTVNSTTLLAKTSNMYRYMFQSKFTVYVTVPGKSITLARIFIDGYYSYTRDLPFHTDKAAIDGQVYFSRLPIPSLVKHSYNSQFRSCVTQERHQLQSGSVDM